MLEELSLTVHTLQIKRNPLLSLLFTESSSESKEGSRGQQMMPELLNEAFSAKAKINSKNLENTTKNSMTLGFDVHV